MSSIIASSTIVSSISVPLAYLLEDIRRDALLLEFIVMKVEHYKEKDAIGHEFLVITIYNGVETRRICIERRPSTRKPAGLSLLRGSSYVRVTDDSLSRIGDDFDATKYLHLSTITCDYKCDFSLRELCNICHMINSHAPEYRLSSTHCYWFCAAFLALLKLRPLVTIEQGPDYHRCGRYRWFHVVKEPAVRKQIAGWNLLSSSEVQESRRQMDNDEQILRTSSTINSRVDVHHEIWTREKVIHAHAESVASVVFTPDDTRLVSSSADQTVRIWNRETGYPIGWPLRGHTGTVISLSMSPDGRHVASASRDKTVRIWDLETGLAVGKPLRAHTYYVWSVAHSRDGRMLISGSLDGTLRIWDVRADPPSVCAPITGHTAGVLSVAISPDGAHVASGSEDCTLRLWDVRTRSAIGDRLGEHDLGVRAVDFSPDGARVVSASWDATVKLWHVPTAQPAISVLRGHTNQISSVAFSPDGTRIVSAADDMTVRVWNALTSGPACGPLEWHNKEVNAAVFSHDGLSIASGSYDKTVRIWNSR